MKIRETNRKIKSLKLSIEELDKNIEVLSANTFETNISDVVRLGRLKKLRLRHKVDLSVLCFHLKSLKE